ncbi:MAG TPA: hypothetical protein VFH37_02790 [Candidatus Saccharimonadales bacterium]|nr:hypothetical protein [Candidatus Saccharimonadales bacterium]
MKPADLYFKNKRSSRLFLLLCIIGVAVVAWWAWVAGPIRTQSAISSGQNVPGQSKLSGSGYNPLQPASPSGSGGSVSTSGSNVSPVAPPASTQPSYPVCHPPGAGIQPDIAYPCNCTMTGSAYPCCQYGASSSIMCPENL